MCGAISGALSMSLPLDIRSRRGGLLLFNVLFSIGRVASYGLAGALAAWLGSALAEQLAPLAGVNLLRLAPSLMIVLAGLYIGGWLQRLALVEKLGAPLWSALEPIGRRLIPVRSPLQALLYGAIWGWLPCGLVYWALFIAASADSAIEGAGFMVIFGLATLPAIVATGMLAGWIHRIRRLALVKQASGILLIVLGLAGMLYATEFEQLLRPFQ
jgi:hypothetical protein